MICGLYCNATMICALLIGADFNKSNTRGDTSGAEMSYTSGAPN
jgi:hypothetical protein